eukprot:scaffold79_cov259-Pinguiococcus_pyrenoidosus.AAC.2
MHQRQRHNLHPRPQLQRGEGLSNHIEVDAVAEASAEQGVGVLRDARASQHGEHAQDADVGRMRRRRRSLRGGKVVAFARCQLTPVPGVRLCVGRRTAHHTREQGTLRYQK